MRVLGRELHLAQGRRRRSPTRPCSFSGRVRRGSADESCHGALTCWTAARGSCILASECAVVACVGCAWSAAAAQPGADRAMGVMNAGLAWMLAKRTHIDDDSRRAARECHRRRASGCGAWSFVFVG